MTFIIFLYLLVAVTLVSLMSWRSFEILHARGATTQTAYRAWRRLLFGVIFLTFLFPLFCIWQIHGQSDFANIVAIWWHQDWGYFLAFGLVLTLGNMLWTRLNFQ